MSEKKSVVEFERVWFGYRGEYLLENISFSIAEGDFVAILGHNGAGKTTLIKLALGLLKPSKGMINIFGKNIDEFTEWNRLGYLQQSFQELNLDFPANVEEIVLLGRLGRKNRLFKYFDAEDYAKAKHAMELAGVYGYRYKLLSELSGGQRQKVFLARVLANEPEVLFLDEPTNNLDFKSQTEFFQLLKALANDQKKTIVLISHDIGQILNYANRVFVVNRRVVLSGKPEEFDVRMLWSVTEQV